MEIDEQEPEAPENPVVVTDEQEAPAALGNQPTPPRIWFITMEDLEWNGVCNVQAERGTAENSARRLLESQSEESLVWDPAVRSVSFAIVDEHPTDAVQRVYNRFIDRFGHGGFGVKDYNLCWSMGCGRSWMG